MSAGKNYLLFSNEKLNRRTDVVLAYNECIYVIILLILFDYIIFNAIFNNQNITFNKLMRNYFN